MEGPWRICKCVGGLSAWRGAYRRHFTVYSFEDTPVLLLSPYADFLPHSVTFEPKILVSKSEEL